MSISLVSAPKDYQPAYNPIEYIFSSSNSNQCEFNYVADLYVNGVFAIRVKTFPNSPNAYGSFRVERILQDYLSYNFDPEVTDFSSNNRSICDYYIEVRERYNTSADCTGIPTLSGVLLTTDLKYAWNGALQYHAFPNYTDGVYDLQDASSRFLTSAPNGIKLKLDDYFTMKLIQGLSAGIGTSYELLINTYDFNNNSIASFNHSNSFYNTSNTEELLLTVPVGPKNIEGIATINSNVNYYTISVQDNSGNNLSETKKFFIKDRCTKYKSYRFWWLNRLGGFDAMTFDLKSTRKLDITRRTYNKLLSSNYEVGDRGDTVIGVDSKTSYTVASDWITEEEAIWLEELFTSPEVYVYETQIKTNRVRIDAAVCDCPGGLCEVIFVLGTDVSLPIGTLFTFNVNDGSPIGMANSGTGNITGYGHLPGEHKTNVSCLINAGAFINGTLKYEINTTTKIPIVISNANFEEKIKVNVKNIQYTMEFVASFDKKIQSL